MVNKVVRRIDKQGRLQLPFELVNFSTIRNCKEIAMCSMGDAMIRLRPKDKAMLKKKKVISCVKVDEKRRIIIPLEIRQETQDFEIFLFEEDLILKEAPK